MQSSFLARYPGRCAICDSRWNAGARISRVGKSGGPARYACAKCVEAAPPPRLKFVSVGGGPSLRVSRARTAPVGFASDPYVRKARGGR